MRPTGGRPCGRAVAFFVIQLLLNKSVVLCFTPVSYLKRFECSVKYRLILLFLLNADMKSLEYTEKFAVLFCSSYNITSVLN